MRFNETLWKALSFLRELFAWQLFFLVGIGTSVGAVAAFMIQGKAEEMLFIYLGALVAYYGLWLRKAEQTRGRDIKLFFPNWFHCAMGVLNLLLGIIKIQSGDKGEGVGLIILALISTSAALLSLFVKDEGDDDDDDGDDDDEPEPPKPWDWLKKEGMIKAPLSATTESWILSDFKRTSSNRGSFFISLL